MGKKKTPDESSVLEGLAEGYNKTAAVTHTRPIKFERTNWKKVGMTVVPIILTILGAAFTLGMKIEGAQNQIETNSKAISEHDKKLRETPAVQRELAKKIDGNTKVLIEFTTKQKAMDNEFKRRMDRQEVMLDKINDKLDRMQ